MDSPAAAEPEPGQALRRWTQRLIGRLQALANARRWPAAGTRTWAARLGARGPGGELGLSRVLLSWLLRPEPRSLDAPAAESPSPAGVARTSAMLVSGRPLSVVLGPGAPAGDGPGLRRPDAPPWAPPSPMGLVGPLRRTMTEPPLPLDHRDRRVQQLLLPPPPSPGGVLAPAATTAVPARATIGAPRARPGVAAPDRARPRPVAPWGPDRRPAAPLSPAPGGPPPGAPRLPRPAGIDLEARLALPPTLTRHGLAWLATASRGVRVHADDAGDRAARQLGAEAITVGPDIFVRTAHFDPGSPRGLALLSHELVHVIQQRAEGVSALSAGGATRDRHEREALAVEHTVLELMQPAARPGPGRTSMLTARSSGDQGRLAAQAPVDRPALGSSSPGVLPFRASEDRPPAAPGPTGETGAGDPAEVADQVYRLLQRRLRVERERAALGRA
jgi:hypothetical protein